MIRSRTLGGPMLACVVAAVWIGGCGAGGDSTVVDGTVFSGLTLAPNVVYYMEEQDFQHTLYLSECDEPCTYGCNQLALDFCDQESPGTYTISGGDSCTTSSVSFPPQFAVAERGTLTVNRWSGDVIDIAFSVDFGDDGSLEGTLQTSTFCPPGSG